MKNGKKFVVRHLTLLMILLMVGRTSPVHSDEINLIKPERISLQVTTCDSMQLPAQVLSPSSTWKKMIVFINGSTPYDEKGNLGASWTDDGTVITEKHDIYVRFLDIMTAKGYALATMAKRSFIYPQRIPRPSLDELALDIVSFIHELKNKNILHDEKDIIIVGYSEGSIVATKVLGLMEKQPEACILLGSGSLAFDYITGSWHDWYMTDMLRKTKKWNDDQIRTEYEKYSEIMLHLLEIDELIFENDVKKGKPHGFAQWESYRIDREVQFYDPVPNILRSDTPVLLCVGSDDTSMPPVLAQRTYNRLIECGFQKSTIKVIENENHGYHKYDVFEVIGSWIDSKEKSVEITLDDTDRLLINKYYHAIDPGRSISNLPWTGSDSTMVLATYTNAKDSWFEDSQSWFKLGILLFTIGSYDESLDSFNRTLSPDFIIRFAAMTWIGHIYDVQHKREDALTWYRKALEIYPGFPVQHDQWGIQIDEQWIKNRIETPFTLSLLKKRQ
jgi:predicted esterase